MGFPKFLSSWIQTNTFPAYIVCLSIFLLVNPEETTAAPSPTSGRNQPFTLIKRSAVSSDYPEYTVGVQYDEYPVVVPKRAALLLDRIMVALQKAVDEDNGVQSVKGSFPVEDMLASSPVNNSSVQRRGNPKNSRGYWRQCFFNAVTCF